MPGLTTADLLNTPTGQQMVAEAEEQKSTEEADKEAQRQQNVGEWESERATLADLYATLRDVVLDKVAGLAEDTDHLGRLLRRIKELDSFLQKNGVDVPSVRLPSKRQVGQQIREVAQRLYARL